jgi:hypothetical protein
MSTLRNLQIQWAKHAVLQIHGELGEALLRCLPSLPRVIAGFVSPA